MCTDSTRLEIETRVADAPGLLDEVSQRVCAEGVVGFHGGVVAPLSVSTVELEATVHP